MNKIKIALDVDGVILNFMQTISTYIENNYNLKSNISYATTQYSLYERFDEKTIENLQFTKIKEQFEKEGYWKKIEGMPEIELIKDLFYNPIFEIYFVTTINTHLHQERLDNLQDLLGITINHDNLICVPLGKSKKIDIKNINPDFFIEDNLDNLIDCRSNHKSIWIDLEENYYDTTNKEKYNIGTVKNLNEAIIKIKESLLNNLNQDELITEIQTMFSDDLLTPLYKNMSRVSKTEGHCYAGAEALYHILGGNKVGLIPCVASFMENGQKMTHWWLKDKNNKIIDPTAEQFYAVDKIPPYHLGKGSGFLTKYPSKRAKEIIKRMVGDSIVPEEKFKKKKMK